MTNEEIYIRLIAKHRSKGLAIDSNLLLLLIVGIFDRERIEKFKRTNKFVKDDFDCLVKIVKRFKSIITTPNILTEVDNLSKELKGDNREDYLQVFKFNVLRCLEKYVESSKVVSLPQFIKFGITDTSLFELSRDGFLVLTIDFPLANSLEKENLPVINFNHVRAYSW